MFWLGMLIGTILMYIISYAVWSYDQSGHHATGEWYTPLQVYFYDPLETIIALLTSLRYLIWQLCQIRASIFLYTHKGNWRHFKTTTKNWSNEDKKKFVSLLICSKEHKKRLLNAFRIEEEGENYDD